MKNTHHQVDMKIISFKTSNFFFFSTTFVSLARYNSNLKNVSFRCIFVKIPHSPMRILSMKANAFTSNIYSPSPLFFFFLDNRTLNSTCLMYIGMYASHKRLPIRTKIWSLIRKKKKHVRDFFFSPLMQDDGGVQFLNLRSHLYC